MNFISEDDLNQFLTNELDFLFVLNMDVDIINVNTAVTSILGYEKEDLQNHSLLSVYPSEYKDKVGLTLPLIVKGDVSSCPYPVISKKKKIVPVDMKFYMGWLDGENVLIALGVNLSAHYFSKDVFYNIFNGADIMMVLAAIDATYIYNANRAFRKALGYSIEEISGKTVQELNLFVNRDRFNEILAEFHKSGTARGEGSLRTKSGEILACWFSLEKLVISDESYIFFVATDITERKLMETKLKHLVFQQKLLADVAQLLNEQRDFDEMVNTVLELIGQHTNVSRIYIGKYTDDAIYCDTVYEWCNEGIESLMDVLQKVHFSTAPSWNELLSKNGRILADSINQLPKDITDFIERLGVKSLLVYPLYINNRLWGFIGFDDYVKNKVWQDEEIHLMRTMVNNIANALERKSYIEHYKNSEVRLRLALNAAKEGMWDWNIQTDEVFFTDACFTMLGYEPNEMSGQIHHWKDLIHPDDWPNVMKAFRAHLRGNSDYYECVFRAKTKNGTWKWVLDHGKVVEKNADGEALRAVGTHIDMTKQKEAEHQLQELLSTKDRLFSIISHDLRGPIGSFMQIIELLTSDVTIEPSMQTSLLHELKTMSKNTFYLLENLLNWSRAQRSEIEYAPQPILINDLVSENRSLLLGSATQKGIEMHFNENHYYHAYADYNMVNLVIRNLLSNAIKFSSRGGVIDVLLARKESFVEVTVKDSGVGMTPDVVAKLFTKNHYHSTYGTDNEKGSGLGLMLCQDFVSRNGGKLRVESEPSKGSSFIFTLPAVDI
ncbi:PAS domain S-box protein [uncultured Bacteroides sp.]|uniref:PAS domain S-box protein n=1 Tax=uncultured Bacteroides sp. TaxID=162156 RepID=UPI002AAB671F|nr:PAS domain S-box protein [uncultured Bacteroides sp.]